MMMMMNGVVDKLSCGLRKQIGANGGGGGGTGVHEVP